LRRSAERWNCVSGKNADRPTAEEIAASAKPAPLAPGYMIRLDAAETEGEA
jgi:hypothetical protein